MVSGYFTWLLGAPRIRLAPTCTAAFVIAAQAVLDGAQDEVIVMERSFDCWPLLLEKVFRARVVYAPRAGDGQPDAAAIAAACTLLTITARTFAAAAFSTWTVTVCAVISVLILWPRTAQAKAATALTAAAVPLGAIAWAGLHIAALLLQKPVTTTPAAMTHTTQCVTALPPASRREAGRPSGRSAPTALPTLTSSPAAVPSPSRSRKSSPSPTRRPSPSPGSTSRYPPPTRRPHTPIRRLQRRLCRAAHTQGTPRKGQS